VPHIVITRTRLVICYNQPQYFIIANYNEEDILILLLQNYCCRIETLLPTHLRVGMENVADISEPQVRPNEQKG